jgi:hypothetical protein
MPEPQGRAGTPEPDEPSAETGAAQDAPPKAAE